MIPVGGTALEPKNYFTRKVVDHFKLESVQGIILKHRILGTAMAEVAFE